MTSRLLTDERGVILVQVALLLVVLIGFSALVVDNGVLLVARAQAQNAADAGALAAATVLAFDTMASGEGLPAAQESAVAAASSASIWGAQAGIEPPWVCNGVSATPGTTGCPSIAGFPPPPPRTFFGATVRVYRNGEQGSTRLPTYFASLFGVSAQDARAQATATVVPANTSTCVWPLAIPDIWGDVSVTDPPDDSAGRYVAHQYPNEPMLIAPDEYRGPPTYVNGVQIEGNSNPTGIVLTTNATPSDSVLVSALTITDLLTGPSSPTPANPWPRAEDPHAGGRVVAVQIPRADGGGFAANLTSCNRTPIRLGSDLALEPAATFADALGGAATRRGQDPAASWNAATYRIRGSCASNIPPCDAISPRLVVLPVFDPDVYDATRGSAPRIKIVNFVGFFISDVAGQIVGNLSTYPGSAEFGFPFVRLQYLTVAHSGADAMKGVADWP